jgi:hypothetical protein
MLQAFEWRHAFMVVAEPDGWLCKDIPAMAQHFLARFNRENARAIEVQPGGAAGRATSAPPPADTERDSTLKVAFTKRFNTKPKAWPRRCFSA